MRIAPLLPVLLLLSACGGSSVPTPMPSTLVTTITPQRGSAPAWLTAYGSATPAQNGAITLSINQPGQVTRLMVTTGAAVRTGQPILIFAVSPSARSGYEQARTQLQTARQQRDTTKRLLGLQLATRDQMAQAEKAVTDAQAALAALAKEGAGSAAQTIAAPFAGIVTAIPVAQGDRTQPGAPLATIVRAGGIVVTVGVPPEKAGAIRVGQRARIRPLDGGALLTGQVVRVDRTLDPQTKLVDVDLSFPASALLPGASVSAEIATGTRSGWLVPHDAVVTADGEPHIFQIAGGKARVIPVTDPEPGTDIDLVEGAIDPARPLIVEGAYQVQNGDAVHGAVHGKTAR